MISNIKKGISIIPNESKNKFYVLIFFQLIKFFLEVVSLGLIMPLIFLLAKGPEILLTKIEKYLDTAYIDIVFLEKYLSEILILILISVFLIKFLFILFSTYFEKKCIEVSNVYTSTLLFNFYTKRINLSAEEKNYNLIRNITSETNNFYKYFVTGLISFFSESIKAIGYFVFLILINFKIFLISSLILIFFSIIYLLLTKQKLINYGKQKSVISGMLIKYITEGIESVKEIKLSNNYNFFLAKFKNYALNNANIQIKFTLLQSLPRQILELIFVLIVSSIILFLTYNSNGNFSDLLFILGVYVAAILKLIPTINLMYKSFQDLLYSRETVRILSIELNKIMIFDKKNETKNLDKKKENLPIINLDTLVLKNICFSYNNDKEFISNFNYTFKKGHIYCIFGPSGSGKSTIINLIMSFLEPQSGEILINNKINILENQNSWFNNISYLPQKIFLLNDNIINNVAFGVDEKKIIKSKVLDTLDKVNLNYEINKMGKGLYTELGNNGLLLSGGQVQRLGIARNLYSNKNLMILDEFTSSLDQENELMIFREINKIKKDKIIIIVSHSENIKSKCDYVLKIFNGKIN